MNQRRRLSLIDRCLAELDMAMRVVSTNSHPARPSPGSGADENLNDADRELSARLMRVNHSGEIAAQALYRAQALTAANDRLRNVFLAAADEENDHLAWCRERAEELGGGASRLAPFWYVGSFAIGFAAGLAGDRVSLGFLEETERQVTCHLDGHLDRLPDEDARSRAILEQMRADEIRHAEDASERGGMRLPPPVRKAMQAASRIMTNVSFRL